MWTRCGLDVDSLWIPFPHNSAPNVDPMWTRCGLHVASVWILFPHNSAPNVDRCGLDVDSLWIPFPHTSAPNVDRCGRDVDSMWTRFGLLFSIVVRPMWTQTPFSIYNNIGGGGESPHGHHCNIVLGPRGSKWGWVLLKLSFFLPSGPNIPEDNYVGH